MTDANARDRMNCNVVLVMVFTARLFLDRNTDELAALSYCGAVGRVDLHSFYVTMQAPFRARGSRLTTADDFAAPPA